MFGIKKCSAHLNISFSACKKGPQAGSNFPRAAILIGAWSSLGLWRNLIAHLCGYKHITAKYPIAFPLNAMFRPKTNETIPKFGSTFSQEITHYARRGFMLSGGHLYRRILVCAPNIPKNIASKSLIFWNCDCLDQAVCWIISSQMLFLL